MFVHEWFEHTAQRRDDRPAIESSQGIVTYQDLRTEVSDLVAALRDCGASNGDRVAVCSRNAVDVVVGCLASLTARCVFVPLAPDDPPERTVALTDAVSPAWALVEPRLAARFEAQSGVTEQRRLPRFNLLGWSGRQVPRPTRPWQPDDLCYIYFTSGSTGTPKAIGGRMRAIDHFIQWEIGALALNESVRGSQLIRPTFDAFLRDMFVPLCAGGVLCVPDAGEEGVEARSHADWLADAGVTLIHCVPSLLRPLLREWHRTAMPPTAVRHVLVSGEVLRPADVRAWFETFGARAQLVNLYGPSETTMVKFAHWVKEADRERERIPIGKPIDGTTALLLDDEQRPAPPGEAGEIAIATPYRSLGYVNDPAATSAAFIINPLGRDADDVIYRTGDIGRLAPDGVYEFLGRRDRQVKVGGVRVELGGVEAAIAASELCDDNAVVDVEPPDAPVTLTAFVVLRAGHSTTELREWLAGRLPLSHLPARFVAIERLPRTPNGKVDVAALRADACAVGATAPRDNDSQLEALLASIWTHVLGVSRVASSDDFFLLGGHSLLAARMLAEVRATFSVNLGLRDLFEASTLEQLTARIALARSKPSRRVEAAPAATAVDEETAAELSAAQYWMWRAQSTDAGCVDYNWCQTIDLEGALALAPFSRSVGAVLARHRVLRTVIVAEAGQPRPVVLRWSRPGASVIDVSGLDARHQQRAVTQLVAAERRRVRSLSRGPLIELKVVRIHARSHLLLVSGHQIVSDGWSLNLIWREIAQGYAAAAAGNALPRLGPAPQYADYVQGQQRAIRGGRAEARAFWARYLAGAQPLSIPADAPRRTASHPGRIVRRIVPRDAALALTQMANRERLTPFMLSVGLFGIALHRWTGERDLVVASTVTNRGSAAGQQVVGWLPNFILLRLRSEPTDDLRAYLRRVRESLIDAFAHQELAISEIVLMLDGRYDPLDCPWLRVHVAHHYASPPLSASSHTGLVASLRDVPTPFTLRRELALRVDEGADAAVVTAAYASDVLRPASVRPLLRSYTALARELVDADPARLRPFAPAARPEPDRAAPVAP